MQNEQATGKASRSSLHGQWSSRFAFVLAVTGSAVGLGNVWRFPYITGENGGGAFVLVYLLCVFLIGMPVMMSEILIGRRGRRNPVATMALLGEEEGSSRQWRLVGVLGVLAGVFILSYYNVIAGWTLAYIFKSMTGAFADATPQEISAVFNNYVGDWRLVTVTHTLFMILNVFVIARGVERGLEQAVRFMVPALVLLMLILLGYSMNSGHFGDGLAFMLSPDFDKLTWDSVLVAMGQAFFTLSIGMGAIMAYGAYLPQETSITGAATAVVTSDTLIAMLAGLVIFPLVFANGLDPAEGPGLVFNILPLAFGKMTGGTLFATLFFVLLAIAAWTSAIGLLEPPVAWMMERFGRTRAESAIVMGILVWLAGFGTVLSFNELADLRYYHGTIFENISDLTTNIMLPLSGALISIFAAWIMCRNSSAEELGGAGFLYKLWRLLARFVAPTAILFIFLKAVGWLPDLSR